jgi:hypothetical protein
VAYGGPHAAVHHDLNTLSQLNTSLVDDTPELKWMWADAQLLPGLHWLAKANPLRWSRGRVDLVKEQLTKCGDVKRPVKVMLELCMQLPPE